MKAAEPLTTYVGTTTFANGTVSTFNDNVLDNVATRTEYDSSGQPTATYFLHILTLGQTTTMVDPLGRPTATAEFYVVETTATLFDSNNVPTATVATQVAETASLSTVYDQNGHVLTVVKVLMPIPTSTVLSSPLPSAAPSEAPSSPSNDQTLELRRISDGIYLAGLMLPTLLAVLVVVPLKILNQNVNLYHGFHALVSARGASAADSLWLRTTGPASVVDGLLSFRSGHYLLGLTTVLVVIGAFTVPLSVEVFRLVLQGPDCHAHKDGSSTITCSVALGVYPVLAQVLSALVILLIVGVVVVAITLRRWRTGLQGNPWNMADMVRLAAGTDMRKVMERLRLHDQSNGHGKPGHKVDTRDFVNKLRTKTFGLRPWEENGVMKYSVLILNQDADVKQCKKAGRSVAFADETEIRPRSLFHWPSAGFFSILSLGGRILFIVLLAGVLTAVAAYSAVVRPADYEPGLAGKAIGIRFLFCGAGVLISFAWGSFFNAVAFLSPYKLLHSKRPNKSQAIAMSPPSNPFTGVRHAFSQSRRDVYLGIVSATAIASELLPVFLGNISCSGVRLESAETVCVYLSAAILSIMIAVVVISFFVQWPMGLGVDPSTIAGAMYAAYAFSVRSPLGRFFREEVTALV
ncbi:hypothetical protein F5Y17DRAFT_465562 [Xylariaceae sp. FL0594]|nr:hypothetical protein F5Y17DRAFT_465562 [Xylariaceae sp. FL0594]